MLAGATTATAACGTALAQERAGEDDRNYRAGIGMLTKGLNDLAAGELRTYLQDHPDGAQAMNARYSLAVCLVRLGKHGDAAAELERVVAAKDFEFAPDALLLSAQCKTAGGDDAAAAAALRKLIDGWPRFGQLDRATAMLGEALYRAGNFKEASEALAGVRKRWPASPLADRAELLSAMAERALGRLKGAAELAAKLRAASPRGEYAASAALVEAQCRHDLGELDAAAALYEHAGAEGSGVTKVEALLGRARLSRVKGELAKAEQALAEATKTAGPGDLAERVSLERGKVLFGQNKVDAAAKVFAAASRSESAGVAAEAALWSAKCEVSAGKSVEAAEHLRAAAERHADSGLVADMLFDRAAALVTAGKDAEALDAWAAWRGRFAKHELAGDALIAQAWCAHRLGKIDQSAELCRALVKTDDTRASEEAVQLLTAENHFAAGQFEAALAAYSSFLDRHPKSTHAWRSGVRRGLTLALLGRDDEAVKTLEPLLAGDGGDLALRRSAMATLGDRSMASGEWARAERWFSKLAAESAGGAGDALLRQGISVQRQGRHEEAIGLFERVMKGGADSPQTRQAEFERGQSLIELGRLDEARDAMERVVAREKTSADDQRLLSGHALRHLASIASRQGRTDDAAALLADLGANGGTEEWAASLLELASAQLVAGKHADAESTLRRFLKAGGEEAKKSNEARVRLAAAINRQGRHAEAVEQLDAINEGGIDAETRAAAHYERALALRSMGRETEATAAMGQVLNDGATRLEAYAALELSQAKSKAGRHEEAVALLARCVEAAERLKKEERKVIGERAAYQRAASLLQLELPAETVAELGDYEERYPKSPLLRSVQLLRGEALLSSGQTKGAVEHLRRAAAPVSAGEPTAVRGAALLRLGAALAMGQDWAGSDETFTAYLDDFGKSDLWFQARFGQGWARENQGRHESAMEAYRDVVERHKGATAARAQFQIGECLFAQKKYEQAAAELLKADVLFAYPEWSAAALYEAGRCLAEMGRKEDAAKQLDELSKRFPDSQWAKMAKERAASGGNAASGSAPAAVPGRPRAATKKPV
jgi:TolA-binding protein